MEEIDPAKPMFYIEVKDRRVAVLFDPRLEDMFWCSYRLEPVDDQGDLIIHDDRTWETVGFVVKDQDGRMPNPLTFSGGFRDFCDRKTDRLSFRSLWPPRPSLVSRGYRAAASLFRFKSNRRN